MLRFFSPISADDAQQQQHRTFQHDAVEASATRVAAAQAQLRRAKPGRPRKLLSSDAVLIMAAAAKADAAAAQTDEVLEQPTKRGKYENWFASPFIHDILSAYRKNLGSAKKTVEHLMNAFPRLPTETEARFHGLSESTVRSWFDADKKLLPKFQAVLDAQKENGPCRGPGRCTILGEYPEIEEAVIAALQSMRDRGLTVNILIIRLVMRGLIKTMRPQLLRELRLSKGFVSKWAHSALNYSWRVRTTAASKLPNDWRDRGIETAKRIAVNMQLYKVHPSLVVNMDQTGVHLAPADQRTYEVKGAKVVKVIGADDKRQITCCVASSMDGDLLPLQLIFQGKTNACHPPETQESKEAHLHMTHSENHWSNLETMKQWVDDVLLPYAARSCQKHNLPRDSHIVLVLDVWKVHIGEEFRRFLRGEAYSHIHLVYVPASCTSQLQVADVILQRPFKHGLRKEFTAWAANIIQEQLATNELFGLAPYLKMSVIKPEVVKWCLSSWRKMGLGRDYIKMGWHTCVLSMYNVHDETKRLQAVEDNARGQLEMSSLPVRRAVDTEIHEEDTPQTDSSSDEDEEDQDVLDVMKARQFGARRSSRKRSQPAVSGYLLNSQQIALSEDSGMDN
jgi:sulfur relay (sulfurtransferase) DsrC/TusE family protein